MPNRRSARRRNSLKLWTWAAAIFAVVAAGMIFAVSVTGACPTGCRSTAPISPLRSPICNSISRPNSRKRELPKGTEYFAASGTITNIGSSRAPVPTILIVLRDARDRIVYSWEVAAAAAPARPGRKRDDQRSGDQHPPLGTIGRNRLEAGIDLPVQRRAHLTRLQQGKGLC